MIRRIDRWMFESFALTPRSLGIARILIGAYLVLYQAPLLRWTTALPDSFFRPPPGPLQLTRGVPSSGLTTLISVGISMGSVALLVGYRTRLASCATGILLFVADGLVFSFGDIQHHEVFFAALLVIMAGSDWGAAYSLDGLRRRDDAPRVVQGWPVALAALLLGFLMLSAALPKVATGWLDPSALAVRAQVVHHYFASPQSDLLGRFPLRSTSAFLWKPLDYLVVLFEGGFIFAIVSPRWLRVACAIAVMFHLAVFVAFGIDFTRNVVAFAVFVEWSAVVDRVGLPARLRTGLARVRAVFLRARTIAGPLVVLAGIGLYSLTTRIGAPIEWVLGRFVSNPYRVSTFAVFGMAAVLALPGVLAGIARDSSSVPPPGPVAPREPHWA